MSSKYVRPAAEGADPFGTARLRRGVLDAWATSPARFREDANAEEDLVLGGYRDRLVIELAQNAADAAARAGAPGRLRLTLRDNVLVAANTGAPLDAAGVESLATLRASAKRDAGSTHGAVGRFGVGFAAVLSVTDEPALVGRHGGVRWSLDEARELAADTARHSPGLGDEVRRRAGHVPLLRLPFAAEGTAPDPYDTAVILPLRDAAAADLAERLLTAVDDTLLLTLPGLQEVVIEVNGDAPRTLRRRTEGAVTVVEDSREGTTRWRTTTAPGPLTDFLVQRAADAYAALLAGWRPVTEGAVDLVPGPLGKGELDGALRQALLERLPRTAFLPPALPGADGADGEDELPRALRPRDAEIVEGAGADTVRVLAEVLPTLLPAGLERRAELRMLGVARLPLADAVDRLAGLEKDPDWWWRLYDSLAGVDPDRLSGLPVPLADGRTTIGPRQVLLPTPDGARIDVDVLGRLGLKVAHEDATHPLLEKLGALPATPRAVLTTPQVRAAVAASLDEEGGLTWEEDAPDAEELAETVLGLVRDAGLEPGEEPWLGALALPDEDGELVPAGELVYPGSPFARVIRADELPTVAHDLAERWGEQPLTACGVLAGFALVRATDVVLDPDELEPREGDFAEPDDAGLLDAVDVWCEDILDRFPDSPVPPVATELVAVRDLDLVADDHWPEALSLLARPPLRDALTQPVRVLLPDGTHEVVRSYTAWWLRGHPVLDGRRPAGLRAAGGDPLLRGLYDEADATGFEDEQVLRALGVRTSVGALLDEPGGAAELLDRLADPDRPVTAAQLHGLYGALAELDPEQVTLPDELRAVLDGRVTVVDAADAVVVDSPDLLPFTSGVPLLPVRPSRAAELAELLQVRRLSESVTGAVHSEGTEHDVPEPVRVLLGPRTPETYVEHGELVVDGVEIDWRLTDDGVLHAATLEGVAAGLAWAAGQWPRRFEVAALLEDPSRTEELARDRWFD
ncbi:molecular chaperone Hsp90 [Streptomyces misionensis]|uniref:Molecular chaperone Hsp90 n=1 Tax=Streptomyces misionensis TaxID=67331 RepID=A0A5C6JJJ2_9ACTN|nr:molecular chaperone Hsp90 [Streptomyces misionensis]